MTEKQHGGRREGSGRKPTGRSRRQLYITESEELKLRLFLKKLRSEKK